MLSPYTNTALEMAQKIKLYESICHKYFLYKKALREREAEQFKIKFEEMSPEGVLKAKTEAKASGIDQIAKSMLSDSVPIEQVQKYTGLTLREIEALQK